YYDYNLSSPPTGTPIGGRTFDIRDNSFALELAEIEFEKVPGVGEVGFKLDLAYGDTQDQILSGIQAFYGTNSVNASDRNIQHASVSYLADIGRGLRIDAGKFVTHIGGETIAGIKNNNFSHSYFYSYAIPFQDTGVRLNYAWTDTFYTELYILNGWNTTNDNDTDKSVGASLGWTMGPFSWYLNYLGGRESDTVTTPIGSRSTHRDLIDSQLFLALGNLNLAFNYDWGQQNDVPAAGTDVEWSGYTFWARYKMTDAFEPSLRFELYDDPDGFTVGQGDQQFTSATLTLNYKLGTGATHILLRPEVRWDQSDTPVALFRDEDGNPDDQQTTVGVNAVFYF
ncbi:MAG: outer membrane beta-barrel protein, partial [Gammaproteobacteria bacterium]